MFCFGLGAVLLVRRFPWPSLVLLQLAIWSRTDAIVFILPMILMNRRFWKAPLALCLANVAAFAYSLWVFRPLQVGWTHPNAWSYWLSECVALWKYLGLVAWPAGLSVDHDVLRPGAWIAVVAIVGLGGLAAVLWRVRTSAPALAFGGAWFFVALAPAALIPNADILTESRVYPAVAGISVALAWAMAGRWRKPVAALVVAGLIVATPVTLARNRLWNRDVALWKDAAEKSPLKPRTHYNLGVAWAREGKVDQAEQAFRRAFALDPSDGWSAAALGYCAEFRQDLGRAETLYLQAVSLDSGNRYAQEGLDRVRKREDESESAYNLRGKSGVALSDPEFSRPVDGHAPGE
jgi:tetratricopeptide (TPR) repeat protein